VAKHLRPLHFRRARDVFSYLRVHPDLSDKEFSRVIVKLMNGFSPGVIAEALAECLDDLGGPYGAQLLVLIDQLRVPSLARALHNWALSEADLPIELRLQVITVLQRSGEDTTDLIGAEESEAIAAHRETVVEDLLGALASEPAMMPSLLEGLSQIGPDRRAELSEEFTAFTHHPAMPALAKYLAMSYDPVFAAGALKILGDIDSERARCAIRQVARAHPLPVLRMRARQMIGAPGEAPPGPESLDGFVTMVDGRGSGGIVLTAKRNRRHAVAWFLCNAESGVKDLVGHVGLTARDRDAVLRETLGLAEGLDVVGGATAMAEELLADALTRCGPRTPLELSYWLDQTIGLELLPRAFEPTLQEWSLAEVPAAECENGVWEILWRVGCWFEEADLVYDHAEALLEHQIPFDGLRPDHPACREIISALIRPKLACYRRMLQWMAALWREQAIRSSGRDESSDREFFHVRVAMTIARDLEDPCRLDDGYAFLNCLARFSLFKAMRNLVAGVDLRDPDIRRAAEVWENCSE